MNPDFPVKSDSKINIATTAICGKSYIVVKRLSFFVVLNTFWENSLQAVHYIKMTNYLSNGVYLLYL